MGKSLISKRLVQSLFCGLTPVLTLIFRAWNCLLHFRVAMWDSLEGSELACRPRKADWNSTAASDDASFRRGTFQDLIPGELLRD